MQKLWGCLSPGIQLRNKKEQTNRGHKNVVHTEQKTEQGQSGLGAGPGRAAEIRTVMDTVSLGDDEKSSNGLCGQLHHSMHRLKTTELYILKG